MANIENIIRETPIIQTAIEGKNIPALHDALLGLFNLRSELQNQPPELVKTELLLLEETIGRIIVYLSDWNGIDSVAGELLFRGGVSSRGDVYRLAAPILDYLDRTEFPVSDPQLVGVVGQIASGKGTVGKVINDTFHGLHMPLSDRLREFAVSLGQLPPHPRQSLRQVNDLLKPRFGNPVFVRWTILMARRLASVYQRKMISFDGFRSLEEAELFKSLGGVLIGIIASPDIRFQRLLERNRGADDANREDFNASDEIEQAWINPIFAIADTIISNEGTQLELEKKVLEFMQHEVSKIE